MYTSEGVDMSWNSDGWVGDISLVAEVTTDNVELRWKLVTNQTDGGSQSGGEGRGEGPGTETIGLAVFWALSLIYSRTL